MNLTRRSMLRATVATMLLPIASMERHPSSNDGNQKNRFTTRD
jgi:hypothetical protein